MAAPLASRTLLWKYASLVAAVVAVPLIVSGAASGLSAWREAIGAIERLQRAEAQAAAAQIDTFMARVRDALRTSVVKFEAAGSPGAAELRIELASLLRHHPEIDDLAWRDRGDRVLVALSRYGPVGGSAGHAELVEAARRAAPAAPWVVGDVYFRKGSEPYVPVAVAAGPGGSVLSAEVNLKFVREAVSRPHADSDTVAYVTDGRGLLIAHPDLALVLSRTDLTSLPQVRRMLHISGAGARGIDAQDSANGTGDAALPAVPGATRTAAVSIVDGAHDRLGTAVVSAAELVPGLPWVVFAEQPRAEALRPVHAVAARTLAFAAACIVLALAASLVLARRLVRPLREMEAGARALAAGDYGRRIAWRSDDELGALAEQFNRMAARLQETLASQEQRIAERTRELAQANEAKTRFLAAASHDLRQPVHALSLLVAQLRLARLRGANGELASSIEGSVRALEALLDSLLDLSQLDIGAVHGAPRDFAVHDLLARLGRQFAPAAQARGLRLRVARTSLWVRSDPMLLERILLNLLGNALRYTLSGTILLGCRRRGDRVELVVADSGIGIAPEHLPRVFDEFYRAASATESVPGLGLGLSIVQRLARLLGHAVTIESTIGRGTVVRLLVERASPVVEALPEGEPSGKRTGVSAADPLRAKRVLVIDDDGAAREAMRGLLTQWRCEVETAADGHEAEALVRRHRPDVVLCDLNLAGGGCGIDVLARLQAAIGPGLRCGIVTAETSPERIDRARGTGFPLAFKPAAPAKLRAMLEHLVQAP